MAGNLAGSDLLQQGTAGQAQECSRSFGIDVWFKGWNFLG